MANVLGFGNRQWHNAVPNNMKVAIPFEMGKEEVNVLRAKLENAGMNYYGYIVQEQDKSTVKISIPQKELDDFCRISGMENPVVEQLNSVPADEERKKQKQPVGNVSYGQLYPACRLNCDVETALLAESRMEYQKKPVSMKVWSFENGRASISTNQANFQTLSEIVNQIQKSRESRPKEAEKKVEAPKTVSTPEPAPKPTVEYSEMADEDVRKLAKLMMNNSFPSARNDLQKFVMFGEPPAIRSPFFDNKTVIDFRKGIDVSEEMGKKLFDNQTGSFFQMNGIHIRSAEKDSFAITTNGKNYNIPYSRLGVAVEENLKEDFASDKRFQGSSHINANDMEDVKLLYESYKRAVKDETLPTDEQKHGIAIAERFLLANETGLNVESPTDKIALALTLSHIGAREKFTDYSLEVDYKKTLPQNVIEDIVKNAVEYKELILNSGENLHNVIDKVNEAKDTIDDYKKYYLKISQQLSKALDNSTFIIAEKDTLPEEIMLRSLSLGYALDKAGEIELKSEKIVEKPEPEKEPPKAQESKPAEKPEETKKADDSEKKEAETAEPKKRLSRRKKEEIKDFGRYVSGAKKESYAKKKFAIEDDWDEEKRNETIKRSNIWQFNKKEHLEMRNNGVPVELIYYINRLKDKIPPKPFNNSPEEQQKYVDFVNGVKDICEQAVKNKPLEMQKCIEEIRDKVKDLALQQTLQSKDLHNLGYLTAKVFSALNGMGLTEEVKKKGFLASPEQQLEIKVDKRFTISGNDEKGFKILDGKVHSTLPETFSTREEAREKCKEIIKADKKENKPALVPPQLLRIERIGEQYRGEDEKTTSNDVMERFRISAGQFGEAESQTLRQDNLNLTFDSMKDLAKVLNVKTTDLGLDRELAIAFGARGVGRAVAHYEADKHIINLTKERGAGSLAHEYAHALDRYIKESLHLHGKMASDNKDEINPLKEVMDVIRYQEKDGVLCKTDYFQNACELAKKYSKAGNGYWNQPTELFARAFACYVTDKLAEMGMKNDFLSGHSDFDVLTAPQGEERKNINQAIDKMIEKVKALGLMEEPIVDKTQELCLFIKNNIYDSEEFVQVPFPFYKTDECTLDGKNYFVMETGKDCSLNDLFLVDSDGVVYDDNLSVNYSQYDSLEELVCDSICTNTAKVMQKDTGISKEEAFSVLKKLYEEGTLDFDDLHNYNESVNWKLYEDGEYYNDKVVAFVNSAVTDILNNKEEEIEAEAPDLD